MPPVDALPTGPDTIRVLLTTDNHVGYLENDPVRGDDSWKTFQEITLLAKQHDVDLIVQGGDLFHVTKPSKKLLYHVVQSLRLNCLGDRPCELELLSDPSLALHSGADTVNYEDPNLNVSVPVFAISGNHDDATGEGMLLPLDVMAATGLVNYFGQIPEADKITVTPLVFQKGTTKLALYGINNMRDERLQRIMRNGDVTFQKPTHSDDFFNVLCIHQNHARHTMTSYVPEDFLPNFLDFVLWGHEHECIAFPQFNPTTGFDTLQPGSSVATSLSEGETASKHVFIMDIKDKQYSLQPVVLQTVRPFVMRSISLQNENFVEGPASKADILAFLVDQVEEMIEEARKVYLQANDDEMPLPLVRLRVDHTGDYEIENSRRFSNKFVGRIANVNDILLYHRKKAKNEPQRASETHIEADASLKVSIQHLLKQFLGESSLYLIPEDGMYDVTKKFIEQDDKQIFNDYVEQAIEKASQLLLDVNIDEEEFHMGDDVSVKRSFRQLLNKLRLDTKRAPIGDGVLEVTLPETAKSKRVLSDDEKPQSTTKSVEVYDSDDSEPEVIKPTKRAPAKRAPKKVAEKKAPAKRVTKAPKKAAPKKAAKSNSLLDDIMNFG